MQQRLWEQDGGCMQIDKSVLVKMLLLTYMSQAATIPLAGLTAATALYHDPPLPETWQKCTKKKTLMIYEGSSAIVAFAIKLVADGYQYQGVNHFTVRERRTSERIGYKACDGRHPNAANG
jgi:NADPH:quinone reductase-like Zn-dependent oxidoreductase